MVQILKTIRGHPSGANGREPTCHRDKRYDIREMTEEIWVQFLGREDPLEEEMAKNPMDRRAWQATVHRVTQSWTQLK